MTLIATDRLFTPDDVLRLEEEGLYELVDGQLIEKQMSELANVTVIHVSSKLFNFVNPRSAGRLMSEQTFQCFTHDPVLLRRPDVAFIAADRMTDEYAPGHVRVVPDLAVEVVSPNDKVYELEEKLDDYRKAGVKLVWVLYPDHRRMMVYRAGAGPSQLFQDDVLTGEGVLPGFETKVADLFPTTKRA